MNESILPTNVPSSLIYSLPTMIQVNVRVLSRILSGSCRVDIGKGLISKLPQGVGLGEGCLPAHTKRETFGTL